MTAEYMSLYFTLGCLFPPQNCSFLWGIWTPSNTWYPGPTRGFNPNGISIGSAVFAGLTIVTDRQTDHASRSVTIGRICVRSTAMRLNNNNSQTQSEYEHSLSFRVRRYAVIYNNETRTVVVNPPNSAELQGTPYHCPSYIRIRAVVWKSGEEQTDT